VTAEHLTDGWEPDLPVSDTLLRRFLFNLAAFHEVPALAGGRVPRTEELAAAEVYCGAPGRPRTCAPRGWALEGHPPLFRPVCVGSPFAVAGVAVSLLGRAT
jgi:hypothetical protein